MLFLHQVIPGSEGDQVGVVRRRRDGHRPGTPHVRVAQLVGQDLKLVRVEPVVIPQDVVVRGTTGALDTETPQLEHSDIFRK